MYTSLKSFGRGRAVALVLTAVVAAGLVLLHVSGAPTHVSVPASAHAGQLTIEGVHLRKPGRGLWDARRP